MNEIARAPYPPDSESNHPEADEYGSPQDDGTMPRNVETLQENIIGRKIVSAAVETINSSDFVAAGEDMWWHSDGSDRGLVLTLDDGRRVALVDDANCCAYTHLEEFLLHPERVEHVITGVASTDGYTTWHIFADHGDIMRLKVGWSSGNPFYYSYGFTIVVSNTIEGSIVEDELPLPQRELP